MTSIDRLINEARRDASWANLRRIRQVIRAMEGLSGSGSPTAAYIRREMAKEAA